jgi:hypothetical protein
MRDPVERMTQFVKEQKQQAAFEHARAAWGRRLPGLLPCIRAVVEVFQTGLDEPSANPSVSVLVDPRGGDFPLVIAFERRGGAGEGVLRLRPGVAGMTETGASCLFRCEVDGMVCGYRYPFHAVTRDVRPERFADLGEPGAVQPFQIGNAVADFLEWASIGEGCGSRKLRFWSPPLPACPSLSCGSRPAGDPEVAAGLRIVAA